MAPLFALDLSGLPNNVFFYTLMHFPHSPSFSSLDHDVRGPFCSSRMQICDNPGDDLRRCLREGASERRRAQQTIDELAGG